MKRIVSIALLLAYSLQPTAYSQTSNVETVKAWTRTFVIGVPGGTVLDSSGTIADAKRLAAAQAAIAASSNLVAAAQTGISDGLASLDAVIARTNDFTGRIYLAADMEEDPEYKNVWGAIMSEAADPDGTLHYFVHYSRELANPPRTRWYFDIAPTIVAWADGAVATNNATTNIAGYACYDIAVVPPEAVGNVVLRANRYLLTGAPGYPLDIDNAGLRMIAAAQTNDAYTGSVVYTNALGSVSNEITEAYLSGMLYLTTTNAIGGTP